jgi:hypothetical protein
MSTVNSTNYNQDLTVRVFDRFYSFEVNVPANEYDAVYSYFRSVMTTDRAAGNFAVSLFRVAKETNIPPMTLLQAFQGVSGINLNVNLAYYLNMIRSRATLLGVNLSSTPNQYAARAILQ